MEWVELFSEHDLHPASGVEVRRIRGRWRVCVPINVTHIERNYSPVADARNRHTGRAMAKHRGLLDAGIRERADAHDEALSLDTRHPTY